MSNKNDRKIIEQYAQLRQEYNKEFFGLDISAKKVEQEVLSKYSVNQISLHIIEEDVHLLKSELEEHYKTHEKPSTSKFKK